jgi:hypothetical protein
MVKHRLKRSQTLLKHVGKNRQTRGHKSSKMWSTIVKHVVKNLPLAIARALEGKR